MNLPVDTSRYLGSSRLLFATAAILGSIALLHCSNMDIADSDSDPTESGGPDGGQDANSGLVDGGLDSGGQPDDGATALGIPTRMFFVHASPNAFPVRLCYEVDGVMQPRLPMPDDPDQPMPLASFPGIAPGSAYEMVEMDDFQNAGEITPVAVRADVQKVAQAVDGADYALDCTDLVCPPGGADCLDDASVIRLPSLPAGSFYQNPIELLVMSGCLGEDAEDPGSIERCGTGFDATAGNVDTQLLTFYPADAAEQGKVGLLIAHLSPSIDATLQNSNQGELRIELGDLDDPSGRRLLTLNQPLMSVQTPDSADWLALPTDLDGYATTGVIAQVLDGPTVVPASISLSLANVQGVTAPSSLPEEFYEASRSFVFALVGDVTAQPASTGDPNGGLNPLYDGRGLHFIAIPTTMRTAVE